MSGESKRRAEIVRFWRTVEMFTPQSVDPVRPDKQMRAVRPGKPLPWEEGSDLRAPRAGYDWQHTVYCGVFSRERVRDQLAEVFQDRGGDNYDGRITGDSALLAFTVNSAGLLVHDSVTVSACAWAMGRSHTPGPDDPKWLDGFEQDSDRYVQTLLDLGDGKLVVRGGRLMSSSESLLRSAGKLALSAAVDGVTGGVSTMVRESVAAALPDGAVGKAATEAAGKATDRLTDAARQAYRNRVEGADGTGASSSPDEAQASGEQSDSAAEGEAAGSGATGSQSTTEPPTGIGTRPLTLPDIAAVLAWLAQQLGVTELLEPDGARVQSIEVSERNADQPPQQGFLNSFIEQDLARVAGALEEDRSGAALESYLTADACLPTAGRVDVRAKPDQVLDGVHPRRFPLGCWPSQHPLALSQQFAVNRTLAELDGNRVASGLFSVNGPPGTGKTTLLRDVVAALITERAVRLAELDTPAEAFTRTHSFSVDGRNRQVPQLRESLTGYEMVVASANNGAVENITQEIPALAALHREWHDEARYLREPAELLLEDEPAWGAVAARLGKRKHRGDFVDAFWWGSAAADSPAGQAARRAGASVRGRGKRTVPTEQGLRKLLEDPERGVTESGWKQAVARFRAARRTVERLREERAEVADTLKDLPAAQQRADAAAAAAADARQQRPHAAAQLRAAQDALQQYAATLATHRSDRDSHVGQRPGVLLALCTLGRAQRQWQQERERLEEQLAQAQAAEQFAQDTVTTHEQTVRELDATIATAEAESARLAHLHSKVADAQERWGGNVPDPADFTPGVDSETEAARERSAPWADEEFTTARIRLFVEAMRLHEAFVYATQARMSRNLSGVMDVVRGAAPKELSSEVVRAAWQLFFLVVPVVSTTFASYDRMFAGLREEALGWLFVDEAGQATPQEAIGALWRTRRAVAVGDPKQLEPVVVLPYTAQHRLRAFHGVERTWLPESSSVQQLTDRMNRWGTVLPDAAQEQELWVGAPLRVHRRCDDPMFSISNEVAYGGLMVEGVTAQQRGDFPAATQSVWWDVRSTRAQGHWVPEEGERLRTALERLLRDRQLPPEELYVLSPFREVARRAQEVLRDFPKPGGVGTVHTAQGREADVVILVLGTDPANPGARGWAAERPNLLNVAVSRAKRRLIVIGNREAWSTHRHFSVLARQLP